MSLSPPKNDLYLANKVGDVGVTNVTSNGDRVTGFSLIFPLAKFNDPVNKKHVQVIPRAFLLGRITSSFGEDGLHKLETTSKNERKNFSLTLVYVSSS